MESLTRPNRQSGARTLVSMAGSGQVRVAVVFLLLQAVVLGNLPTAALHQSRRRCATVNSTALFNCFNPRCKRHQKILNCGCSKDWLIREKAIRRQR